MGIAKLPKGKYSVCVGVQRQSPWVRKDFRSYGGDCMNPRSFPKLLVGVIGN